MKGEALQDRALYYGDCLDWMRRWPDECADLIYLDPPFNSNANYNIIFGTENGAPAQVRGFNDTWKWDDKAAARVARLEAAVSNPLHDATVAFKRLLGPSGMLAYLTYMGERLVEMRRLLKKTGSLYLHCDPTASHYLKALMDDLFGHQNHRNEIIWERTTGRKSGRQYGRVHDVVLFYSKAKSNVWNSPTVPQSEDNVRGHDLMRDDGGMFRQSDFSGATLSSD